jgi:putative flippase GtrA
MKVPLSVFPVHLQLRAREIILFVSVGLLNTAIDFTILNLLIILTRHTRGLWLIGFTCCGFLAAVINSYILNGSLTFRDQATRSSQHFLRFIAVNVVGLVINSSIVGSLAQISGNRFPLLATINVSKILAVVGSLTWNYIATKRWVFNEAPASANAPADLSSSANTQVRAPYGMRLLPDELNLLVASAHTVTPLPMRPAFPPKRWKGSLPSPVYLPARQQKRRSALRRVILLPINSDTEIEKQL